MPPLPMSDRVEYLFEDLCLFRRELEAADPIESKPVAPPEVEGPLKQAEEHLAAGRFDEARTLYNSEMANRDAVTPVPELRFLIAEAWLREERYQKAILAYQEILEFYPRSEQASWAMLRQGDAFDAQGQHTNASLFYDDVIRLYPGTEAAAAAKAHKEQ